MTTFDTLDDLHSQLSQCRKCLEAGYRIESRPIFSGSASARLMLIGQAPGSSEGDLGYPFGGSAGQRLFRWLSRAGWDEKTFREKCYITAVTKCFPGNDTNGSGDRVPTAAERKLCRPWLDGELAFVQPEVIVLVGRLAIQLYYPPKVKLSDVIGETTVSEDQQVLIPLPHPSGASRWFHEPANVGRLERAIYALKRIKAELNL